MSARTPFVPGGFTSSSRPESRAAQSANVATQSSWHPPPHFVADPSNPLNGGPLVPTSRQRPRRKSTSKHQLPDQIQSDFRPSSCIEHCRPYASPGRSIHSCSVFRLQFLFAQSTFKTPALPVSRLSPQQSDSHAFHASSNDDTMTEEPLSPTRTTGDVHNDNNNAFRLKSLPSQPGPHRIVFGAPADPTDDDEIYEIVDPQVRSASGGGRNKRGRSELDDDNENEPLHGHMSGYDGQQAKRFKADPRASNAANDMYYRSSSPHHSQDYPPPVQQQQHQPQQQSRRQQLPNRPNINDLDHRFSPQITNNPAAANSPPSSDLDRIMQTLKAEGFDLASEARIEKYARWAEKWKTCSREEWIAGADELSELYSKIFDYVKSHMTFVPLTLPLSLFSFSHRSNSVKVKLFANCDEKLKEHGEVLKDRDGLLADVKDRLVAESGNVLGSGD
ncbi:hypothetical protein R3P38DRAFT_3088777 [Favolaschia claudopus]|uniref:Uncharacterized protein n=1 Tax=Favolaschia claudopus TaxID=2862362 RepID=A0AAV9ZU15_9AGAR